MPRMNLTEDEAAFIEKRRKANAEVLTHNAAVVSTLDVCTKYLSDNYVAEKIVKGMIESVSLLCIKKVKL